MELSPGLCFTWSYMPGIIKFLTMDRVAMLGSSYKRPWISELDSNTSRSTDLAMGKGRWVMPGFERKHRAPCLASCELGYVDLGAHLVLDRKV
ncbi:hypothetical protein TorRG33x02_174850 [Trema orientale]|uniref:Uncharacterized protein n=1 Tax=Trema orientale TaxID=63057 RepID=A0A2P5EMQ7_TREOI|nr:hypothetical protein TorRG33x02_174850 [Trema orientale]